MEAQLVQSLQSCTWMDTRKMMKRPNGFTLVSQRTKEKQKVEMFLTIRSNRRTSGRHRPLALVVSSSLKKAPGSMTESGGFPASLDESLVLKKKSQEIEPYLDGRCIYLVGMMGSGKTTVGRILSEALDYSFSDSDVLIEQTVGGMSVAEIFKQHGEGFFRDTELVWILADKQRHVLPNYPKTEVLEKLSLMDRLVVSTGGGAVIRPINWKHMQRGISVWLDVPVQCLARRISAVGTDSRPLLHGESGDAYSQAFKRLSALLQDRGEAYANASARVSLEYIAAKLGHSDVDNITPTVIAIEVLNQIESFLKEKEFVV